MDQQSPNWRSTLLCLSTTQRVELVRGCYDGCIGIRIIRIFRTPRRSQNQLADQLYLSLHYAFSDIWMKSKSLNLGPGKRKTRNLGFVCAVEYFFWGVQICHCCSSQHLLKGSIWPLQTQVITGFGIHYYYVLRQDWTWRHYHTTYVMNHIGMCD